MSKKPSQSLPRPADSRPYDLADWPFQRPCTKEELAKEVRTTTRFLEHEVSRGNLRAVRLGVRSVRFLPSDVVAWLNARPIVGSNVLLAALIMIFSICSSSSGWMMTPISAANPKPTKEVIVMMPLETRVALVKGIAARANALGLGPVSFEFRDGYSRETCREDQLEKLLSRYQPGDSPTIEALVRFGRSRVVVQEA
jgi:hypothetical protein